MKPVDRLPIRLPTRWNHKPITEFIEVSAPAVEGGKVHERYWRCIMQQQHRDGRWYLVRDTAARNHTDYDRVAKLVTAVRVRLWREGLRAADLAVVASLSEGLAFCWLSQTAVTLTEVKARAPE